VPDSKRETRVISALHAHAKEIESSLRRLGNEDGWVTDAQLEQGDRALKIRLRAGTMRIVEGDRRDRVALLRIPRAEDTWSDPKLVAAFVYDFVSRDERFVVDAGCDISFVSYPEKYAESAVRRAPELSDVIVRLCRAADALYAKIGARVEVYELQQRRRIKMDEDGGQSASSKVFIVEFSRVESPDARSYYFSSLADAILAIEFATTAEYERRRVEGGKPDNDCCHTAKHEGPCAEFSNRAHVHGSQDEHMINLGVTFTNATVEEIAKAVSDKVAADFTGALKKFQTGFR
jgi:hypothetical protein